MSGMSKQSERRIWWWDSIRFKWLDGARRVEKPVVDLISAAHRMLPVAIATLISISSACGAHTHNWQPIPKRTRRDAHTTWCITILSLFLFSSSFGLFLFFLFFFPLRSILILSGNVLLLLRPSIQICLLFKWLNDALLLCFPFEKKQQYDM